MNYNLNTNEKETKKKKRLGFKAVKSLIAYMVEEKKVLAVAFIAMVVTAILNLVGPIIIGNTVDNYIQTSQFHGVLVSGGILLGTYIVALFAGYLQTRLMGSVGQRMLYNLAEFSFSKIAGFALRFFQPEQNW